MTIVEVKHPQAPVVSRGDLAGIKAGLLKVLPLQSSEDMNEFQIQVHESGAAAPLQTRVSQAHRFSTRDRQTSVVFRPDGLTLETTAYRGWEHFREILSLAVKVRGDVAPVDGIERIGLRYINEIRVPGSGEPDWSLWVDSSLAAPRPIVGGVERQSVDQQAQALYLLDEPNCVLAMRYGAQNRQPFVGTSPLVRKNMPGPGPFFVLDCDAAWTWAVESGDDVPEATQDFVVTTADDLHGPVQDLFESMITERLREEVLNAN